MNVTIRCHDAPLFRFTTDSLIYVLVPFPGRLVIPGTPCAAKVT